MPPKDQMLHVLVYKGAKDEENMQGVCNSLSPVLFNAGPLSHVEGGALEGQRYGYVTEKQGIKLVSRFPDVFEWPAGTQLAGPSMVSREEVDELMARIEALEALVDSLRGTSAPAHAPTKNKGGRPPKPKEVADALA